MVVRELEELADSVAAEHVGVVVAAEHDGDAGAADSAADGDMATLMTSQLN